MRPSVLVLGCSFALAQAQQFYDPIQQPVKPILNARDPHSRNDLVKEKPKLDRLNAAYSDILQNITAPGGAYRIDVPGKGALIQSFGFDDYPLNTKPFSANNNARVGSVTKTLLGQAILELVDKGNLSLSNSWSKFYNPKLPIFQEAQTITIAHLLGMRSGLKEYSTLPFFVDLDLAAQTMGVDPLISIAAATAAGLSFAPGTAQYADYCNTNFLVLETIFEQVTGHPFRDYLNSNLAPRYGLVNTFYPNASLYAVPQPAAHSFTSFPLPDGSGITLLDASEYSSLTASGAGAVISNMQDLAKWSCILAKGTGLSGKLADTRLKTSLLPFEETAVGLSYGLAVMAFEGDFNGHSGGVPGYTAAMACNPKTGVSFVGISTQGATGINQETAAGMLRIFNDADGPPPPMPPAARPPPGPGKRPVPHLDLGPPRPPKKP